MTSFDDSREIDATVGQCAARGAMHKGASPLLRYERRCPPNISLVHLTPVTAVTRLA